MNALLNLIIGDCGFDRARFVPESRAGFFRHDEVEDVDYEEIESNNNSL